MLWGANEEWLLCLYRLARLPEWIPLVVVAVLFVCCISK